MKTMTVLSVALALILLLAEPELVSSGVVRVRGTWAGGVTDAKGGTVSMQAALGQPVIGTVSSSDGRVTVVQGFGRTGMSRYVAHLPLLLYDFP